MKKDELDEKYKKMQVKADMMEKLSRTLQTERNDLKEKLKVYEPQPVNNETSTTETATENSPAETPSISEETSNKTDQVKLDEQPQEVVASN